MFDPAQFEVLQFQLERAREELLAGELTEDKAWSLFDRATDMLEEARDTEYEESLGVIYTLLQSLWQATRAQGKLRVLRSRLGELDG